VATATLFGGGTLVVVSEPAPLVATKPLAARLTETLSAVAPGNGLAFLDTVDGTARRPPRSKRCARPWPRPAATSANSSPQPAIRWPAGSAIAPRTRHPHLRPAAALLAERVGANVRERDVDRRRQGELAVAELEKLAMYRLDGQIVPDDVKALVADAVPGSTWAFLDAVGMRRADVAAELADRLEDVPAPLLVTHLHRRIKQLIDVADLLASGTPAAELVRILKLNPYVAQKLAEQARTWTPARAGRRSGSGCWNWTPRSRAISAAATCAAVRRSALWIAERVRRPSQR
jgi:hypothetical protein